MIRNYLQLRYKMLPSLVAAGHEATRAATPIVARCDTLWPEHPEARTNDQYIFIRDTLVAPVWNTTTNLTRRSVWIPPGAWEDGWSGETVTGPRTISVEQPYERIPMWHRKGGLVIVSGDAALRVDDQNWSELTLEAWPAADAEPVTRSLFERGSDARTDVRLRTGDGTVQVDVGAASDGAERGWLLRLHLPPGQRVATAMVDGSTTAAPILLPRDGDSAAHFPLRGEGTMPAHRAGPIAELRLPRRSGARTITVTLDRTGSLSARSPPRPAKFDDTPARRHLFIDPQLVRSTTAGVHPALANVTKEETNPVLVPDQPWEVWVSYVSVVPAKLVGGGTGLALYYNNEMCCDSLSGRTSACAGAGEGGTIGNRSVLICDDPRDMPNVSGTGGNPRLSATLRAESKDGVVWSKPSLHQVRYNGSTANNAVNLHQLIPGTSDGRGVFHDPHDKNPRRRYKMVGTFNRAPSPPPPALASASSSLAPAPPPPGYIQDPVPCIPAGQCITDIRHSSVAAGAAKCSAIPGCASFSFYHVTGWVQLWDLNHTEKCLPNPPWTSYRKSSVPAPPQPDPLAQFPGYHCKCSRSLCVFFRKPQRQRLHSRHNVVA